MKRWCMKGTQDAGELEDLGDGFHAAIKSTGNYTDS